MMRCFVLRSKKSEEGPFGPSPAQGVEKSYGTTDAQMLSTPWVRKLAALLHLLSLLGETRVRAQAVEMVFSTACTTLSRSKRSD
jgi:hypothetical protein